MVITQTLVRGGAERALAIFEKDALFYEGTQKLREIMNTASPSQGLLSRFVFPGFSS